MERTSGGVNNRRALALQRLEAQLKSGTKQLNSKKVALYETNSDGKPVIANLSEADISRINREITVLQGPKKKRKNKKVTTKEA